LKVYLSVPMISNRALDRAKLMAKAIADSGNEVSSPWVLGAIEHHDPAVTNIFHRDRIGAETSDAIVADVTDPSVGVGMEIMAAYKARKRIVVVAKKGRIVSRMLEHMDGKELLEYEDEKDIYDGLVRLLK
jgi:2'-deoxynucleoside 5'-phosphate N-hydrolase